jgi:diguanylate cyclase (GGDEF)-like protein/PAS domain S-box-containing protein
MPAPDDPPWGRPAGVAGAAHSPSSSDRWAAAAAALPAALLVVAPSGQVTDATPFVAALLGRAPEDLLGRSVLDALGLAPDAEAGRSLALAVAAGRPWTGDVTVLRPDGSAVPCLVLLGPLPAPYPGEGGVALAIVDASPRAAAEAALVARCEQLAEAAAHDPLTGLCNRRRLLELLEREHARAERYDTDLSVLMVDLDRFKVVNDAHGHEPGDRVLIEVAAALPPGVRAGDLVARIGGDEFAVLLPNAGAAAALAIAERLCRHVGGRGYGPGGAHRLTASVGVATSPDPTTSQRPLPLELLRRADLAQLEAKRRGGDRAVAWAGH